MNNDIIPEPNVDRNKDQVQQEKNPSSESAESKATSELSVGFTKGEWRLELSDDVSYIYGQDGDGVEFVVAEIETWMEPDREANARLIAAAPALYKALVSISTGQCESFTTGIGSCAKAGRQHNAEYAGERWCNSCIAEHALANTQPTSATGDK